MLYLLIYKSKFKFNRFIDIQILITKNKNALTTTVKGLSSHYTIINVLNNSYLFIFIFLIRDIYCHKNKCITNNKSI